MNVARTVLEAMEHHFHTEIDWNRRRVIALDAQRVALVEEWGER